MVNRYPDGRQVTGCREGTVCLLFNLILALWPIQRIQSCWWCMCSLPCLDVNIDFSMIDEALGVPAWYWQCGRASIWTNSLGCAPNLRTWLLVCWLSVGLILYIWQWSEGERPPPPRLYFLHMFLYNNSFPHSKTRHVLSHRQSSSNLFSVKFNNVLLQPYKL